MPSGFDPMGGIRFSEKTMLKQKAGAGCRSSHNSSRSRARWLCRRSEHRTVCGNDSLFRAGGQMLGIAPPRGCRSSATRTMALFVATKQSFRSAGCEAAEPARRRPSEILLSTLALARLLRPVQQRGCSDLHGFRQQHCHAYHRILRHRSQHDAQWKSRSPRDDRGANHHQQRHDKSVQRRQHRRPGRDPTAPSLSVPDRASTATGPPPLRRKPAARSFSRADRPSIRRSAAASPRCSPTAWAPADRRAISSRPVLR